MSKNLKTSRIKILDVGCGTGVQWHKRKKQYHITGIDGAADILEIARRTRKFNRLVKVDLDDPKQDWDIELASFDLVICSRTLMYCQNAQGIIQNLLNAAKGNALLHVDFLMTLGTAMESLVEIHIDSQTKQETPMQKWTYPVPMMQDLVRNAGGQILNMETQQVEGLSFCEMAIKKTACTFG